MPDIKPGIHKGVIENSMRQSHHAQYLHVQQTWDRGRLARMGLSHI